jgi:hypothetical protein
MGAFRRRRLLHSIKAPSEDGNMATSIRLEKPAAVSHGHFKIQAMALCLLFPPEDRVSRTADKVDGQYFATIALGELVLEYCAQLRLFNDVGSTL